MDRDLIVDRGKSVDRAPIVDLDSMDHDRRKQGQRKVERQFRQPNPPRRRKRRSQPLSFRQPNPRRP